MAKEFDFIIVGFGLCGLSLAAHLLKQKKTFVIYENHSQQSSRVAGGLYNPVVLKRFKLAWKAKEQWEYAVPFYKELDKFLETEYHQKLDVLRRFNSVEEQNLWLEASDQKLLSDFMSSDFINTDSRALQAPFSYGKILGTGRIDIVNLLKHFWNYLRSLDKVREESFNYEQLNFENDCVRYQDIKADHIIFSEGFGLKKNPLFNWLPLQGNKGEYLIIKSKELKLNEALKHAHFIIPLGEDLYKVGATYDRDNLNQVTTNESRAIIESKLKEVLKVEYEVVGQEAGIRPTTNDRRPFAGIHPFYKKAHILNGTGSRGILIAPWLADQLISNIAGSDSLDPEANIERFYKKYFK